MPEKLDRKLELLMKKLKIDAPLQEFKIGLFIEIEHSPAGPKNGIYAVIPENLLELAKIAGAHLAEFPDYYTRLIRMEKEGEANKHKGALPKFEKVPNNLKKKPQKEDNSKKPKPSMREILLSAFGLGGVNDLWNYVVPKKKETAMQDRFTAGSTEASEIWGLEEEEAMFPDDQVEKPQMKQANIAAKPDTNPCIPKLDKLREQMADSLHYITNKLIAEAKKNPEQFNSLRELKDTLETSLLTLDETLETYKGK